MNNQHILQVSELTKKVRFILESELNSVWLCGEISNFIAASSGHWYLSLKDSKSQVRCAMFKGNNRRVRITPSNGQQVLVRAKVSLYEPRGDFQLIIEQMEDAGEGLLRQKYEQLKSKLEAEGLFSLQHKQTLPAHVQCVGIVTSPTGAAIKDILSVLKRRNSSIKAIIYPALVQGEHAANDISQAIAVANQRNECDLLIVGRGGGSLEDLWCFNEEQVVRAIFASKLPIVSAVGHEIDTTLADYTADLRAPTPSAAAELISQDGDILREKVQVLQQRLSHLIQRTLKDRHSNLSALQHRLAQVHPSQQLQIKQQRTDELTLRLTQAIHNNLQQFSQKPQQLSAHLLHLSPAKKVSALQEHVEQSKQRIINATTRNYQQKSKQFLHLIEELQIVSPLATIARGYSVTRNSKGEVVKQCDQVTIGDEITIQVSDGKISANVTATNEEKA
ncbi:exodeoxyribonuclease VII large subunit [Colwelliaceae bacterium 6471]